MRAMALMLLLGTAQAKSRKEGSKAEVRADFAMICNAVQRSGAAHETDPAEKATRTVNYILTHISTQQAWSFMQSMAELRATEKAAALKKKARESGYAGACPFADEK